MANFTRARCCSSPASSSENEAQLLHIYFGHIAVHLLPLILHWRQPTVVSFHGADVLVDLDKPHYRAATREDAGRRAARPRRSHSLARAVDAARLSRRENSSSSHRHSAGGNCVSTTRTWPNDGAWKFLQAGRLIEKKGFQTSLRAFAEFQAANIRRAASRLQAKDRCRNELQALARELGVGERVRSPVFFRRRELREQFFQSHIFLHPSETGRRWQSGRRSERDARSDGEWAACFRDQAWRNSGSNRRSE